MKINKYKLRKNISFAVLTFGLCLSMLSAGFFHQTYANNGIYRTGAASDLATTKDKIDVEIVEDEQSATAERRASKLYPNKYTPTYIELIKPMYKSVSKDEIFHVALDLLKDTNGEFSRNAILGNNLSGRPVKIEFKNLGDINESYQSFDALGWKKGKYLYIYVNPRHADAPATAIAALLSHEALHQDEYNSLAEETYAWTLEAAVWNELAMIYPEFKDEIHPLVHRENTLEKLFIKGNYTNQYIKKTVVTNGAYATLPSTSPGFDDL